MKSNKMLYIHHSQNELNKVIESLTDVLKGGNLSTSQAAYTRSLLETAKERLNNFN